MIPIKTNNIVNDNPYIHFSHSQLPAQTNGNRAYSDGCTIEMHLLEMSGLSGNG